MLLFMKGTPDAPLRVLDAGRPGARRAERRVRRDRRAVGSGAAPRGHRRDLRLADLPQLYVNGELVGGADIVEEMLASGELAGLLGVEQPAGVEPAPEAAQSPPGRNPPLQIEN